MKLASKGPRVLGRAKTRAKKERRFYPTKKQKIILGLALLLIIIPAVFFGLIKKSGPIEEVPISNIPNKTLEEPTAKIYSPLTGAEVTEEQSKRPLTAIIIENAPEARPQSGLNEAGIVFEAIAEGGITRFATVYQEGAPSDVGPVRSLRPYYLDWLRPFNSTVAHVGGSKKALGMVRDGSWRDMDQFANGKSFRRIKERRAPHNVYTTFSNIDAYNQAKGYSIAEFTGFTRKDDSPSLTPNAPTIKLNVSSTKYNSSLTYNPGENNYSRAQGGEAHLDKSGAQIKPKVVVALIVKYSIVQEDGSRSSYQTVGSGEAVIFQDGLATPATWTKADQKSQIKLTDVAGTEIKLNRGQTWFTVLSSKDKATWQ
jgi:hypothetical protein